MELTPSLITIALTLPFPSLSRPSNKWREISVLAEKNSYSEIISFLGRQNLKEEINRLESSWLEKCAYFLLEKKCISFYCENYPIKWKMVLGKKSPPSLWWNQIASCFVSPSISIVGNRQIQPHIEKWTHECAAVLVEKGFSIVSGGALGVDKAAALGSLYQGKAAIELLPFGIDQCRSSYLACRFSTCFPNAPFSTRSAMIRNQLVYAYSPQSIIIQSHEKNGGTWHGGINALEKKLSKIYSWDHKENKGHMGLVKRGAIPFKNLYELISNLELTQNKSTLFSI